MNESCPICSGQNYKIIGKPKTNSISKAFINADYKVVQCSNCELYYTVPTINFSNDQWADLYHSEYFAEQSAWLTKKRKKELSERFDVAMSFIDSDNKTIKFLDVGTGEGKTLIEGLNRGWEVTGIDIVDNRIDEAKNNSIKFVKTNLLESTLPENYYDFIYVDSVLEHVLNPLEYLVKINRLLTKGGIVYIGVPNEDCLFNDVRKLMFRVSGKGSISEKIKPFDNPYHVVGFNKNSLKFLFKKTEMGVKKMRNFGRKFDFLSYKFLSKEFLINFLFLFPVEHLGNIINRDIYYEVYLSKK
jgi:ubiquinone/menaquinone biosynthesis C-methylase UbiE